ncbi:hypothetical protein ACIBPB_22630 [Micromonospora sp. NPDC049836]|uniref:hypothetical protein n=1 Tax=Micromonospora sp. NPDC049836 TaxID=3364274 RepID=UPI0037946B73
MSHAALFNLLLAALGLPVVVGGVALVARHFVYQHADEYGAVIRAAGREDATEETVRALSKELTR